MRAFLAALVVLASVALAQEQPTSVLTNSTVACSIRLPSATLGCWWERPVLVLDALGLELAIAVDAQAALRGGESYLAPMATLAWYGPTVSVWLEVALPDGWLPVPHFGRSDSVRLGFSYRF